MAHERAIDALHHVDTILVRETHIRGVDDLAEVLQLSGRFLDDAFVPYGDGRQLLDREVRVGDEAAVAVDVDVRDLAHEQHTALNLAGVAHEFVDLAQRVVVLFVLLVYFHRLLEVLQHALRRRGGVYHFIGGVDDTLCEVRGVGDDPLGAGCPCAEEQPHQKECQTSFHSYSTGVSNSSAAGCVASSGRNRP